MSGTTLKRLCLATLLAPVAALAAPIDDTATLRCVYRQAAVDAGAKTVIRDTGHPIRGTWRHHDIFAWNNMFATDLSPAQLRDACHAKAGTRPGEELVEIRAIGAHQDDPYAYEIWHRGALNPGKPLERIVAFGDSLTDKGNMYLASRQALSLVPGWSSLPSSSWFHGRFSNGPTWVEQLARKNGLTLNSWAVGGSQTRDTQFPIAPKWFQIHGVNHQIDRFIEHTKSLSSYDVSRTLFTFLIAGNDFVNDDKTGPEIIAKQEEDLSRLAKFGARRVLVVNLPDVSRAPVFRLGRKDAHTVLGKVEYYNKHIGDVARRVAAATGADIRVVDVRTAFDDVLANPARHGFTNTTDSCLALDKDSSTAYLGKQAVRPACDPDKYVFWDTLHPTTRMHALMAGWAAEAAPAEWGLR
ncbi:MAG: SGNH/GDSL hydrolase family protein [Luteibacter sp.]